MQKSPIGCTNCAYRRPISSGEPRLTACHYLLDTGEQRGCPPHRCTRWQEHPTAQLGWDKLLNAIRTKD